MLSKIYHKVTQNITQFATTVRMELLTVFYISKDPRSRWYVKALSVFTVAYCLSPIDLIPDFVPILGMLDDLIIVPFCIYFILKITPPNIVADARYKAQKIKEKLPKNLLVGVMIILFWLLILFLTMLFISKAIFKF